MTRMDWYDLTQYATFMATRRGCECPHVSYLTRDVERREHECQGCGERFIDTQRPMRYFGNIPPKAQ